MYPTLLVRIASIGTAAQSAAMKGFDALTPYLIQTLEVLCMIGGESVYGTMMSEKFKQLLLKRKQQLDERLKTIMLSLPPECGGFPIMPFPAMLYRGHPDPVSLGLFWLRALSKRFVEAKRILDLYTSGYFLSETIDPVQLIQDPQSLNFEVPIKSFNKLKHLLDNNLRRITKNKIISDMLKFCSDKTLRKTAEYLFKTRPLTPRVLNELLRLSPDGSMLSFLGTFTDMRTMKQVLGPQDSNQLLYTLQQGDIDTISNILLISDLVKGNRARDKQLSHLPPHNIEEWLSIKQSCTTSLSQELREIGWDAPIQGVTIPHPAEQTRLFPSEGSRCTYEHCTGDEFILFVLQESKDKDTRLEYYDE